MSAVPSLRCAGCGEVVSGDAADIFRCPAALSQDGRDHVLVPEPPAPGARFARVEHAQPFARFRELLWSHRLALARGLSDADFVACVESLDRAIAGVDGHGFLVTPFSPRPALAERLGLPPGSVWVKDETGNVSGSHKARHLFGLALVLEIRERIGLAPASERSRRELAIASCGNAALAAAVVARAAGRALRVFIPTDANPRVVARLRDLGAAIEVCERRAGEPGDPCVHAFRSARAGGAIPFCVQGNENGLTIEGGETLAWEMAETLAQAGVTPTRLFVQTGGGALASACVQGLDLAVAHALLPRGPRLHVVQTTGALPFRRAWERLAARIVTGSEATARPLPPGSGALPGALGDGESAGADRTLADSLGSPEHRDAALAALRHAREHRARYMWPWESTPVSLAHGILDDETYDWAAVLAGSIESGGWPLTVSEARLAEARDAARDVAGIAADATGAAGLAGLMELSRAGAIGPNEHVVVVFSGVQR